MARKGENIYKRKDGRWEGRYIKAHLEGGKAQYGYVYAKSYREVKYKLIQLMQLKQNESIRPDPIEKTILFCEIATEWFNLRLPQLKDSTAVKYRNLLNSYILPMLGERAADTLTHDCIKNFCNELLISGGKKGTGLSPKTVSDILSVLRNILKYCTDIGIKTACDARSIIIKQSQKEMRIFTRNEQDRICQYLFADLNSFNVGILVCLFTGIRIGEICALQRADISLSERTIHVHQTMQRIQTSAYSKHKTKVVVSTPKSACSIRTIPLPSELVNILSAFSNPPSGYFLTGSSDTFIEPRTMQNHFKRVLKECSIEDANYHVLRHTFATRCVELGFDAKSLSEILGHASVSITMNRYVHPSMELKRDNMQRLSSLFAVK